MEARNTQNDGRYKALHTLVQSTVTRYAHAKHGEEQDSKLSYAGLDLFVLRNVLALHALSQAVG